MSKPKDGGPAFPGNGEIFIDGPQGKKPQSAWGMEGSPGMSLRAWMAAIVTVNDDDLPKTVADLVAFMGKPMPTDYPGVLQYGAEFQAKVRVIKADALIAELEREK